MHYSGYHQPAGRLAAALLRLACFDCGSAPPPCQGGKVQRPARHFPAQGSPVWQVAQPEECCCLGHSPDHPLCARINEIQTNDFIGTVLL